MPSCFLSGTEVPACAKALFILLDPATYGLTLVSPALATQSRGFYRECQRLFRLRHRNIVVLFGVCKENGLVKWMVCERASESVKDVLEREPAPPLLLQGALCSSRQISQPAHAFLQIVWSVLVCCCPSHACSSSCLLSNAPDCAQRSYVLCCRRLAAHPAGCGERPCALARARRAAL